MKQLHTYILDYLKEHHKADILGFGSFFLKDAGAKVLNTNGEILPPAKEIFFQSEKDANYTNFVNFLAKNENITIEKAENLINLGTKEWKNFQNEKQNFKIEGIGSFYFSEGKYLFQGERIENLSPDFFGLEKISLSDIQSQISTQNEEENPDENYKFNNAILWTFLFAIPVVGLLVAGVWYSPQVFGKKSFDDFSVKQGTSRIENKVVPQKKDSLKSDTIKVDSLKNLVPQKIKK